MCNRMIFFALLALLIATSVFAAETRPNVLLIIADDQAYNDFGFTGHRHIKTPNLDKLAENSLVLQRAYVTTALDEPSRATIFTGLYPHQHGVTGNRPAEAVQAALAKCRMFPDMLAEAGYVTFNTREAEGPAIGRETMQPVLDFIDKAKASGKPFFLCYAPNMPAEPHNAPARIREKYDRDITYPDYHAMCEWFDETCGTILDYLKEKELTDNTLVVFLADNGWRLAPARLTPQDADTEQPRQFKGSPYDAGVRTTMLLSWPGHIELNTSSIALASNIDIAPTILTACGLKPTPDMPGIDLMDREAVGQRQTIFLENYTVDMTDPSSPEACLRARSCISGVLKLIVWQDPQPAPPLKAMGRPKPKYDSEMYMLNADPREYNRMNVPEKDEELRKLMDDWWKP